VFEFNTGFQQWLIPLTKYLLPAITTPHYTAGMKASTIALLQACTHFFIHAIKTKKIYKAESVFSIKTKPDCKFLTSIWSSSKSSVEE
jgi:hypothetical protein